MIKKIIITILIGAIIFGIGYGIINIKPKNPNVQKRPVLQETTVGQNEVSRDEEPFEPKEQIYLLNKTMIDLKFRFEDLVVKTVDKERELEVVFEIYLKHDNELEKIYFFDGFAYRDSSSYINKRIKKGFFTYALNITDNSLVEPAVCILNEKNNWIKRIKCGHRVFLDDENKYFQTTGIKVKHPTLIVYDLQTDEIIKTVVYEFFDNSMYPVDCIFKDNAFYVTLSADTTDFADLKIPVDPEEDYTVLDSLIENTFILSKN